MTAGRTYKLQEWGKVESFNIGPYSYACLKDFPKLCKYIQGNFWN